LVDYISPLYEGNFNILHGPSSQGQKQVLNSLGLSFLNGTPSDTEKLLIYITYSRKEANNIKQQLDKLEKSNYVIFTLSDLPSDTEYYYLPRIALAYANEAVAKANKDLSDLSVLFLFDDVEGYIFKDKNLSQIAKSYVPLINS
jgi:hypothetical protein